jgi:hypothetical protein
MRTCVVRFPQLALYITIFFTSHSLVASFAYLEAAYDLVVAASESESLTISAKVCLACSTMQEVLMLGNRRLKGTRT